VVLDQEIPEYNIIFEGKEDATSVRKDGLRSLHNKNNSELPNQKTD
jgi:5S rRNA maturation endonuclease (ribonuclease M5)